MRPPLRKEGDFSGSSRKVGEANTGLSEAPKAARGRSMKARPTLRVRRRASKLLFPPKIP
nr:MAG TPA: hypothetical protein [Caudoviricetes sp.]